ncbi:Hypothetical predicted protein, partial [Pelobates cultripes]
MAQPQAEGAEATPPTRKEDTEHTESKAEAGPCKRQWRGSNTTLQRWEGKVLRKRSRQSRRPDRSPPQPLFSGDEEPLSPPSLEVMDEWRAEDSPSEEEDCLKRSETATMAPNGHTAQAAKAHV